MSLVGVGLLLLLGVISVHGGLFERHAGGSQEWSQRALNEGARRNEHAGWSDALTSEKLIPWKTAAECGLKPVRTLDLRVERQRAGNVFFIQEFVEYDNGKRGWRRRTGEGFNGNPFTHKFKTEADAEVEIAAIRLDVAVQEADSALSGEFGTGFGRREDLKRLWNECEARELGLLPNAGELVRLFREQQATVAAALNLIRAQGGDHQPQDFEVALAFQMGRHSVSELAAWWFERRNSADLKLRKEKERSERRIREDAFLYAKADEKAVADGVEQPVREALSLAGEEASESILDLIADELRQAPYLRHILVEIGVRIFLYVSKDGLTWTEWGRYKKYARKRQIAVRAVIADAFGMDPKGHWGKVRGALLKMLKPSALDTLHRKDVQEALGRARAAGQTLVVIRQLAFLWDEDEGKWCPREIERRDCTSAPGCTLWVEGPIESTNHGRIIVLPYVKEDGTEVVGHTRSAPHEGRAAPRAETKVIRFAVYDELGRDDTWDHYGNKIVPGDDEGSNLRLFR